MSGHVPICIQFMRGVGGGGRWTGMSLWDYDYTDTSALGDTSRYHTMSERFVATSLGTCLSAACILFNALSPWVSSGTGPSSPAPPNKTSGSCWMFIISSCWPGLFGRYLHLAPRDNRQWPHLDCRYLSTERDIDTSQSWALRVRYHNSRLSHPVFPITMLACAMTRHNRNSWLYKVWSIQWQYQV